MNVRWTEKDTKIEQVRTREFRSFGDNVIIECTLPSPMERCLLSEKSKDSSKVSASFKDNLILLNNTSTPGQYTNSWLSSVSLRVATRRPLAFCSWPTEPTLRKSSCNNIQIGSAQAKKPANYLYFQTEQLLEAC